MFGNFTEVKRRNNINCWQMFPAKWDIKNIFNVHSIKKSVARIMQTDRYTQTPERRVLFHYEYMYKVLIKY